MNESVTIRDRWHNFLQRGRALRAALSLYAALGRRGRNGIWVFWSSLDPEEQRRYVRLLRAAMNECWHKARAGDVPPGPAEAETLAGLDGALDPPEEQ